MTPAAATDRLAAAYKLSPGEAGLVAELLAHGATSLPADPLARKVAQVHCCRLRVKLAEHGPLIRNRRGGALEHYRRGKTAIDGYGLDADGQAALLALAAALPEPPTRFTNAPGLKLSKGADRILHAALVAAGPNYRGRETLLDILGTTADRWIVDVHLNRLRPRVRAAGLVIETKHGVGWRYRPDTLASYLAAHPPHAPGPHLAPIKKGDGAVSRDRGWAAMAETNAAKAQERWARRFAETPPGSVTLNDFCRKYRCEHSGASHRARAAGLKFRSSASRSKARACAAYGNAPKI